MKQIHLPLAEIELIAVTRGALGLGIGLLVAHHLTPHERRLLGWLLIAIGGLSTFPLRHDVLNHRILAADEFGQPLPASREAMN